MLGDDILFLRGLCLAMVLLAEITRAEGALHENAGQSP